MGSDKKILTKEPFFDEIGHIFPANIGPTQRERIFSTVRKAVHAIGLENTIFHAEVRVNKQGVFLLEIGARLGGDYIPRLVKLSTGLDLAKVLVDISTGKVLPRKPLTSKKTIGIAFLTLPEIGYGKKIKGYTWNKEFSKQKKHIVEKMTYFTSGSCYTKPERWGTTRVGHIIFTGHPKEDVLALSSWACSQLNIQFSSAP